MAITPPEPRLSAPDGRGGNGIGTSNDPGSSLVTRLVEEMVAAWRQGERPRAEEFLARHPGLSDESAIRLVYEEACLREEEGDEAASIEILNRFPRWKSKLALLLDCNRLLRMPSEVDFPEVGEELGDFRILNEIGRGAQGRTFLASQQSLAERLVVLKITPLDHDEHLSLARLQHMHIVPLYFEQVLPDRPFRVLGMPYLGGTTLARIFDGLRAVPVDQRTGSQIVELIDRYSVGLPTEYPTSGPFRKYLGQKSYAEAICWIGACLADALQYAHDRGLVHMDVKASNLLLAGDGQPMLLDFHLAREPIGPALPVPDRLGGTPGFMAPEQRAAMAAIREGRAPATRVDGRADIYSLGLLLYEALGGAVSLSATGSRQPLARCNPRVSPGLSDIVAKCLADRPLDRYRDAAALAIDLRRHLNDQPLRGVKNRSLRERWRKWRRRRPYAVTRGLLPLVVAVVATAALSVGFFQYRRTDQQIQTALTQGQDYLKAEHFEDAKAALAKGLALAVRLPANDRRKQELSAAMRRVLKEQTVADLHKLVDRLRFQFGIIDPSADEARSLFRRGMEIWAARSVLAHARGGPEPVDPVAEQRVKTDLLDLATILAELRAQETRSGEPKRQALAEAVQILRDARTQFGPSPALLRDLSSYAEALGWTDMAKVEIPTPRTAWEHYNLGRSYLRTGELAAAQAEFRQAVAQKPDAFWPHFSHGISAYRLKRYGDAVASLSVCVALAPTKPECFYNRALAYQALGESERAADDYSSALARNAAFAGAALNRGILFYQQGRYPEAIGDFETALETSPGVETRGLIYYNLALVHHARKDLPATRTNLEKAIACGDASARALYARLGLK
jgi:serine/threonine protein kinase/Tfp pilus assembly protein PilF